MQEKMDEDVTMLEDMPTMETGNQLETVRNIKYSIIGSRKHKSSFIQNGLFHKLPLMQLNNETQDNVDIAIEVAAVIGCLGRGTTEDVAIIATNSTVKILCEGLQHSNTKLSITCLHSLRTIVINSDVVFDQIINDDAVLNILIRYLNGSPSHAECASNILSKTCQVGENQQKLYDNNIIASLLPWLSFPQESVVLPIIKCVCSLVIENSDLASKLIKYSTNSNSDTLKDLLIKLLSRSNPNKIQLAAARCIGVFYKSGAILHSEEILLTKVLTSFVRMCRKDKSLNDRMHAAFGLASLIEDNNNLQAIAAISDHLIKNIAQLINEANSFRQKSIKHELLASGFDVLAAVSANEEKIRKIVIDTSSNLIQLLFDSLQENNDLLKVSSLKCLLSLSRSVRQLRTTFQDFSFWQPILSLLKENTSRHIRSVASSVLCNLLLDFSPCKEALIDAGIVSILCDLTKDDETQLRLNGVWGLMNISFDAPLAVNTEIIKTVGLDHILTIMECDESEISMRTLGFLRNVLSGKENADCVMSQHGDPILTTMATMLQTNRTDPILEQVFSVLSNIADGKTSKEYIMNHNDILQHIVSCIMHENDKIQLAAVFCVTNLISKTGEDSAKTLSRLKEMGVETTLRSLETTKNSLLSERVKVALEQFC